MGLHAPHRRKARRAIEDHAPHQWLLDELRRLDGKAKHKTWAVARLANRLHHQFKMTNRRIAQESGVSEQLIGQYIHAVEAINQGNLETGEDFTELVSVDWAYNAHRAYKSFRGPEKDTTTIGEVLKHAAEGLSPRKLRATAAQNGKPSQIQKCLALRDTTVEIDRRKNCFEGDCRDLFTNGLIAPASVKRYHANFPYADHRRSDTKSYRSCSAMVLHTCAGGSTFGDYRAPHCRRWFPYALQ